MTRIAPVRIVSKTKTNKLLSTAYPAFARAKSPSVEPMCSPCGENFGNFGTTFPKATLLQSYWLQQTRSAGLGGTLSQPSCNQHRASPRLRLLSTSWPRRNLSTTKPPRMRGSLEKKLQKSTESVEKLRKLQSEQDMLERLGPALSQAKETTKQSLEELRVMRIAVRGAGADGDKNAPRLWNKTPTCSNRRSSYPMILERGQERNQTWITQPSLNVLKVCWAKPMPFFFRNANTSDIINIDPCLCRRVGSRKRVQFGGKGN